MLYLVEYADFHSQSALGAGWNTGSVGACGGTDGAAYHTVKRGGAHNSYRYVEDPFSNMYDWIDGFVGRTSAAYAAVKDGGYAGGSGDLEALGIALPSAGFIKGFGYSAKAPWAFIPDASGGSDSTYVPDYVYAPRANLNPGAVGGSYGNSGYHGFWYVNVAYTANEPQANRGSRPMYVPGS